MGPLKRAAACVAARVAHPAAQIRMDQGAMSTGAACSTCLASEPATPLPPPPQNPGLRPRPRALHQPPAPSSSAHSSCASDRQRHARLAQTPRSLLSCRSPCMAKGLPAACPPG